MTISIEFKDTLSGQKNTVIVPVYKESIQEDLSALPDEVSEMVSQAIDCAKNFEGKTGQILSVFIPGREMIAQVLLLGLGEKHTKTQEKNHEEAGGKIVAYLKSNKITEASLLIDKAQQKISILMGIQLRNYEFLVHKTQKDGEEESAALQKLHVITKNAADLKAEDKASLPVLSGIMFARNLVNESPNILYPESYATLIKEELKPLGIEIEILDEKKMLKNKMGAIMAVGQGSHRQPRMVVMRWMNGAKDAQPVALVGKGVTFDTGGISIKPGAGMDEMKMDMGGSAAVVGAMKAIALAGLKENVVGIVGLAENMPSANAYRPGDIIKSYCGKTVEVLNTDAEGRLVLADALSYVQKKDNPHTIIDLATLTGAMMVALGNEYCGTFVNDNDLWNDLDNASTKAHEKLWRMPLDEAWSKEMISDVADLRNLGKSRFAGACTAAAFLQHFVDSNRKWAHMDIAGTAWVKADKPTVPKYGTGFGVRTLFEWIKSMDA